MSHSVFGNNVDLCFYGTLCHAPLLAGVLGREVTMAPACLPGWRTERALGGDYPLLMAAQGESASVAVVHDLSSEDIARLRHYEGGFGYDLVPIVVETRHGTAEVQVFRPLAAETSSGAIWDLRAWIGASGPTALAAAQEIMRAYERREPPESLRQRWPMIWARAAASVRARGVVRPTTLGAGLGADTVTLRRREIPYEAFFQVEELVFDHPRHDGGRSGPLERAVFQVCDAVTVLPYDPHRDRVLLVDQFRVAAWAKGDPRPWLLEPIAGMIDAGEAPIETGVREAQEEAGLTLSPARFHLVSRYYPSPGAVAQLFYSYVAIADLPDSAARLGGQVDEGEDIRAHVVGYADLMDMLASGEACNAALVCSAQWLALNRARLRSGG